MALSIYQVSVPVFLNMLTNLRGVIDKAAAHAQAKKIEERTLLSARLFPDMLDLTRQVQLACDFGSGTGARLAAKEPPAFDATANSFADLAARIDQAVAFLRALTPGEIDGAEGREIVRPIRGQPKTFTALNYLLQFALPNFFFHVTTAYAILRHNGVEIGKLDYIGSLD
jgi:hypothetical protein